VSVGVRVADRKGAGRSQARGRRHRRGPARSEAEAQDHQDRGRLRPLQSVAPRPPRPIVSPAYVSSTLASPIGLRRPTCSPFPASA
jgi:hypothetical protein